MKEKQWQVEKGEKEAVHVCTGIANYIVLLGIMYLRLNAYIYKTE